ncbi:hypothetical protein T492DRAFT_185749 [Pavlovales sp. CCMP2436]|nr:hypothetical protein T492DRAFT_185749 [Pavlovales sp. CCMP2436]
MHTYNKLVDDRHKYNSMIYSCLRQVDSPRLARRGGRRAGLTAARSTCGSARLQSGDAARELPPSPAVAGGGGLLAAFSHCLPACLSSLAVACCSRAEGRRIHCYTYVLFVVTPTSFYDILIAYFDCTYGGVLGEWSWTCPGDRLRGQTS